MRSSLARTLVLTFLCLAQGPALAQALSSPLGAPPAQPPGASAQPAAPTPHGQGAGVHSPLSPFAPLPQRKDVVPWSVLTDISTRIENRRIVPVYPSAVRRLDQKTQRIQGFMMPLEPGEQQRHFLLSSVPLTCSFCTPGGPESMVEVRTKSPVKYSLGAVVVEGKFHVLTGDPYGLYYRITEAVGVR
ncbi:MAG TPA: DUF3299 domain-containing protein [Hydrogenophaga sp.]|uniref:DUF3299 domain-containing protein n=1 Tax=Hydrogenophaga sp. TaxID=1904254 RepID=UPI002C1AC371|nr:DUF3299 domain-containing protein [Hydrogenophaga sp.]HMN93100.1 DUF3299 domain-containing protein [Hydrogenophaga sp.]HMP10942.1 DUF3299 domain-containing protein [Hydrogenophaga sp.]